MRQHKQLLISSCVFIVFAILSIVFFAIFRKQGEEGVLLFTERDTEALGYRNTNPNETESQAVSSTRKASIEAERLSSDVSEPSTPTVETGTSGAMTQSERMPVYITGCIQKPGIYEMRDGAYLYELIALAGGFSENAAADSMNLARQLDRQEHVHVLSREEWETHKNEPKTVVPPQVGQYPTQATTLPNVKIDINTADVSALMTLNGIGEQSAKAIVEYRQENGPFQSIEDVMHVPGIKAAKFGKFKNQIYVNIPTD